MTKIPIMLVYLSIFCNLSLAISIQPSEFCNVNCKCDTVNQLVTCNNIIFKKHLNSTEFWVNKDSNASYPFYKVAIQGASLSRIFQFPNSSLQILDLSMNRIEIIDKASFKYLQNMTELDLTDNDLTSELFTPDIFMGIYTQDQYLPLKSLRVLKIANNGLHTLHQDMFEHIINLEVLDIHGNPLRVIDTQTTIAISSLMNLRELDLSYTHIKKLPEHIFHSPKNLKKLNLSGNLLKFVPTQLGDARVLEFLSLNENLIENITKDAGFPKLEKLKILHMCYMENLANIDDGSLSGLWNVEELYISNNPKLSHIGELALARLEDGAESHIWPKVTKLHLNANHLSTLGSSFLPHWDLVVELDINDNPWSCDCSNKWLIDELVPVVWKEHNTVHRPMRLHCAQPIELSEQSLVDLWRRNETLRCLDLYGARPEKDAGILIGILIGLLLGIPIVLGLVFCWKRNFFGYFSAGPAAFSRKFYNPATTEDEFYS